MQQDNPLFSAALYYYDKSHASDLGSEVESTLTRFGFFPPEKICAGKLTRNRFRAFSKCEKDVFSRAYSEPDLAVVRMASGNSRVVSEYWEVIWSFNFLKYRASRQENSAFKPWNVFHLYSTYGLLRQDGNGESFLACVSNLIDVLQPFYGQIDDLSNFVKLDHRAFRPEQTHPVFWGNYWDKHYQAQNGIEDLGMIKGLVIEEKSEGTLFTLTDNLFDHSSEKCEEMRKRILQAT